MIRRALALLSALAALILISALPAAAQTVDPAPAVAFTIDPAAVVQLLVAFIMPVLVGLITTRVTAASRKAWLLATATLITSLLVELGRALNEGSTFDVGIALLAAVPAFVVSVASHYGLWKPTGVSEAAQRVGSPAVVRHLADPTED